MTGEEFTSRFNELFNSDGTVDMGKAATLRTDVVNDYTDADTNNSLLNTAKTRIADLENTNKELHDTNLRLFMMLPNGGDNSPNSGNGDNDPTHTGENDPPSPTVNDVVAAMLGKASK